MARPPAYLALVESGELSRRVEAAREMLSSCVLCPRTCHIDRSAGKIGVCRVGDLPVVASHGPHFGEESPLVGAYGSGTIFMAGCNLQCIFCQNYDISQLEEAAPISAVRLAGLMLSLAQRGCHNINFVTPTHQVPQILSALEIAAGEGLRLPIVYNCGGYESLETLRLLDGVVDIYMPDMKYASNEIALKLSGASGYWDHNREAVREMHRQVGDLLLVKHDDAGTMVAEKGLLVRHLVLPGGLAGTGEIVRFLAEEISRDTCINMMDQYRPCYRAHDHPVLRRSTTREEFAEAMSLAREAGLRRFAD